MQFFLKVKIKKVVKSRDFYDIHIELPAELDKYMVKKGSIAVDGISLTIADIKDAGFNIWVIPETFENTNLKAKKLMSLKR